VASATRDAATVTLQIKDEGVGISADMLERVFEPFVQDRQSPDGFRGGLGLGLTIARALVHAHGGRIRVTSDGQERGSEFAVDLTAVDKTPGTYCIVETMP
jgi:signal transduction histidine kinase